MDSRTHSHLLAAFAAAVVAALILHAPGWCGEDPPPAGGEMVAITPEGKVPMPLLRTEIDVEVSGVVVYGTVSQQFENHSSSVITARYMFPLPENAAVHHMEMRIGDRRIVSVIQEKEEARRTFDRARRAGKKAALVARTRPNLFTASAANVNPGEIVEVRLEYVDQAAYDSGDFRVVVPLTFTPRYSPGDVEVKAPFRRAHEVGAPEAHFRVRLEPGFTPDEIRCVSHRTTTVRSGAVWTVEPRAGLVLADRDVIVEWTPPAGETVSSVFTEIREDGTYALLLLVPPARTAPVSALPTETLFVIDVSGSMAGPSIVQARKALITAVSRLTPRDRFNIMKFNNGNALFRGEFHRADDGYVREATGWVSGLDAGGGTEIYPALLRGIALFGPREEEVVQRIVFLTDGAVGNEAEMIRRILEGLGGVRLHTLGIGPAPNRFLMREMAEAGRGVCRYVTGRDVEGEMVTFFEALERPVLTELDLEWISLAPLERFPEVMPDLHAGEPLILTARFPAGPLSGGVTVLGRDRAGDVAFSLLLGAHGPTRPGIAKCWARAKVDRIEELWLATGGAPEIRTAMLETALPHRLVTRFTSLVAVEERITAQGPADDVRVASALPHGSQLLGPPLPAGATWGPFRLMAGWLLAMAGFLISAATALYGAHRAGR